MLLEYPYVFSSTRDRFLGMKQVRKMICFSRFWSIVDVLGPLFESEREIEIDRERCRDRERERESEREMPEIANQTGLVDR